MYEVSYLIFNQDGRDSYFSVRDAPSSRFPALSAGPYAFYGKELGNQSGTLNGEKPGSVNSQSMTGGLSRGEAIGFMHEVNSHHLGEALPQPMAEGDGPSIGGNIDQGGLFSGSLPQAMADGEGPAEKSSKKLAPFFIFPSKSLPSLRSEESLLYKRALIRNRDAKVAELQPL